MPGVFDFINDFSHLKENIVENSDNPEETIKDYNAYLSNRTMSYFPDALSYAQELNLYHSVLTPRQQFDYYFYGLRKKKRFSKQAKIDKPENLAMIQDIYGFDRKKAITALKILTENQLSDLKIQYEMGKKQ